MGCQSALALARLWHDTSKRCFINFHAKESYLFAEAPNFNPPQGWLLIARARHKPNTFGFCTRLIAILNFEFPLLPSHKTPLRGVNSLGLELVLNQRILLADSPHVKYGEAHLACVVCADFASCEGRELYHIAIAKTQVVVER